MIEVTAPFVPAADCNSCGREATVTVLIGRQYNITTVVRLCEPCSEDLVEKLS